MNYKHIIIAVTAFAAPSIGLAANSFIGLWEGVDPHDGGHQVLSISNAGNGSVNLILYDTYFTLCKGGRGIATGSGTPVGRKLVSEDYKIYCYDTKQTTASVTTYQMNISGNILKSDRSGINFEPVIYHRTNTLAP